MYLHPQLRARVYASWQDEAETKKFVDFEARYVCCMLCIGYYLA